ncbi:hypothetical protein JTB14_013031 [Gonioctena quinquepunctata]|nr:hypothetical protein JTB14_013031 [Gonioctena quinquepunctata]
MSGPDKEKWRQAMAEEYKYFMENGAWEINEKPEGENVVKCKWVFKRKRNSDGSVRYRARPVAKDFTRKPGVDNGKTFSPVVRHSTLRFSFSDEFLVIKLDWEPESRMALTMWVFPLISETSTRAVDSNTKFFELIAVKVVCESLSGSELCGSTCNETLCFSLHLLQCPNRQYLL